MNDRQRKLVQQRAAGFSAGKRNRCWKFPDCRNAYPTVGFVLRGVVLKLRRMASRRRCDSLISFLRISERLHIAVHNSRWRTPGSHPPPGHLRQWLFWKSGITDAARSRPRSAIYISRSRARMPVWQTTVRRCPSTAPVEESSVSPDRCCPTIIGAHSLCP